VVTGVLLLNEALAEEVLNQMGESGRGVFCSHGFPPLWGLPRVETDRGQCEQRGYTSQIPVGIGDLNVTEVRCQTRDRVIHVDSLAVPGQETFTGEAMAKIMQAWSSLARRHRDHLRILRKVFWTAAVVTALSASDRKK